MTEVAIVGIGIHPFGRHEGVSGREQGARAVRAALADARIGWGDVQFASGGSDAAGNADALVNDLGLIGIGFINVKNGCAASGSSVVMADRAIRSGAYDIGLAVGFDKHPPGAFNAHPSEYGLGASGLRQVYENALQLRCDAGVHQIPGEPKTAFTHVYGAPGISACTVSSR